MENRIPIINAGCGCETETGIWFVHYTLSLLLFYEFKRNAVTIIERIPGNNETGQMAFYADVVKNDDKLYLIPCNAKQCWIYDIVNSRFTRIPLKKVGSKNFRNIHVYKKNIYAIPYEYNKVVKIELKNNDVEYLTGFKDLYTNSNADSYINSSKKYNERFIVNAVPQTESYLVYDMKEKKWEKVDIYGKKLSFIICMDEVLYGFDYCKKTIVKFTIRGEILKESSDIGFESVVMQSMHNQKIIVDDVYSGKIKIYNSNLEMLYENELNVIRGEASTEYLQCCWIEGKTRIYGITKSNELIIINQNDDFEIKKMQIDCELWVKSLVDYCANHDGVLSESENVNLGIFLRSLSTLGDL